MGYNIACTIDSNYAQHCAAMLCSLFENNPRLDLTVFVVHNGLGLHARRRLDHVANSYGRTVRFLVVEESVLQPAPVSRHVSVATYFRILLPTVLPEDITKVLFLDSDTIVRGELAPFYDQSVDAYTHAAVESPDCRADAARLGLPAGSRYFNAGVLLLNLRRWRDERLPAAILQYIRANHEKLIWWDQDALNAVLQGRWLKCPPCWNAIEVFFDNNSAVELDVDEEELVEARSNPRIVHFCGSLKPWHRGHAHPFKNDYYAYLAKTPWQNFRPPAAPTAVSRLKGRLKSLLK